MQNWRNSVTGYRADVTGPGPEDPVIDAFLNNKSIVM